MNAFTADRSVERWIVGHRAAALDPVFKGLSLIGTWGAVWLVLALVLALAARRPELFLLVAAADLLADLLATGLKDLVGRARPHLHPLIALPASAAFPSGHAATSFACATVLALSRPRLAPAVLILATAIAYSRLYLGVHWPTDVAAGALLGVLVATALRLPAATRRPRPPALRAG